MNGLGDLYKDQDEIINRLVIIDEISDLRYSFMEATTNQEVNDIRDKNLNFLNKHPECYKFLASARHRINGIRRENKRSWKTFEKN
jgi:hypothetical protein